MLSSVNMASQPIRWHRTGVAAALFAASVVVDIAGAPSPAPSVLALEKSKDLAVLLALDPQPQLPAPGRNKTGAAEQGRRPANGSE